jgi:acyl-CoA synthetase (AMP-forming)/AMP-acid ligase II
MTADHVAHHAAEHPDAVAVIHDGRAISFAELRRDIGRFAEGVRALGLMSGATLAVGTNDVYVHWLLLLACERLGIAAASFADDEGETCAPLLASADLVLAAPRFAIPGAKRHFTLTQAWIDGLRARPDEGETPLLLKSPDDPVRIVRTSGTTGASKRFLVTRRMHDALSTQWQWALALSRECRYLQTLPMVVRASFDLGSACLRVGGTLVLENRPRVLNAIAAYGITHAILLPVHLKDTLDHLPPDFVKPSNLTIVSFGAAVSDVLRERASRQFAVSLCDLYGTVEVAAASAIWHSGADGFGTILPRVQVEAVDENNAPVAPGEIGRIRFKTECMCEGYLDDPETTQRMFRDGWFYPGDVGVIGPGRKLKIQGRADDLLNIGGQKILPAVLETSLMQLETAGDVGVCSMPNEDGFDELCIALANVEHGDQEVMDRIMQALRRISVGRFHVVKLARIPRSANGKLQRNVLREDVARVLRGR